MLGLSFRVWDPIDLCRIMAFYRYWAIVLPRFEGLGPHCFLLCIIFKDDGIGCTRSRFRVSGAAHVDGNGA